MSKLFTPSIPKNPTIPETPWGMLRYAIKPYRLRTVAFFATSLIGVLAWTASPFAIAHIVTELNKTGTIDQSVWLFAGFYIAAVALDEIGWRTAELIARSCKPQIVESIRTTLFAAVLRKSYGFFVSSSSGRIGHWINDATSTSNEVIDTTLWTVWGSLTSMIVSAIFLFFAHWSLAVLFITWLTLLLLFNAYRGKAFAKKVARQSNATSLASGIVVDSISNHVSVRVFNARQREQRQLIEQQQAIVSHWRASWSQNIVTNFIKGWSSVVANILALIIILNLYSHGIIHIGDIVLFVAYFGSAGTSLWQLAWAVDSYFRNFGTLQNALSGLQGEDERQVTKASQKPQTQSVSLELSQLSFAYPERADTAVVSNLNLKIAAGEKVGVVGHSGAGKSTLVGLLLGLYEPTNGGILINGVSTETHDPSYIRSVSSFVPQDTNLFNRSVRDNVLYARPDATEKELTAALKQAQAYDFIQDLPDGIDTIIGERGVKLSGGQRQRLAIARAMLHNAPLIIMDEATSALDSISEQAIQKALHQLMKRRTSIVIAHRLSTLKHLDKIVVMDKGRISEVGTHDELLKQNGIYAALWQRQKDGFIAD